MIVLGIGLIAICLGGAVGYIAVLKGRSFVPWFLYGTVLGPVALPHALLSSALDGATDRAWSPIRYGLPSGHRTCPYCDAAVHEDAIACRRCRRPFYGPGSEAPGGEEDYERAAADAVAFEALEAAIARRKGDPRRAEPAARAPRQPTAAPETEAPAAAAPRREPEPPRHEPEPPRQQPSAAPASAATRAEADPADEPAAAGSSGEDGREGREAATPRSPEQPPAAASGKPEAPAESPRQESEASPWVPTREQQRAAAAKAAGGAVRTAPVPGEGDRGETPTEDAPGRPPEGPRPAADAGPPEPQRPDEPAEDAAATAGPQPSEERPRHGAPRDPGKNRQPEPPREPASPANDPAPAAPRHEPLHPRPEVTPRPAAARAHHRWHDAAAGRGETAGRPLRAGDAPPEGLRATPGAGPGYGRGSYGRRHAIAAAAVVCVMAVGGLAWWFGPAALQVVMGPPFLEGDPASADLDGKAIEVPKGKLAETPEAEPGRGLVRPGGAPPGGSRTASRAADAPAPAPATAPDGPDATPKATPKPPAPKAGAKKRVETASADAASKDSEAGAAGSRADNKASTGAPAQEEADNAEAATPTESAAASAALPRPTDLTPPARQMEGPAPSDPATATAARPPKEPSQDLVQAVTAALAEHARSREASADATQAAATPAAVRITAMGDLVARVQQLLRARGFEPGPVDGRAGPQTREAIRKYQMRMGMRPTGEIDKAMLISLGIL